MVVVESRDRRDLSAKRLRVTHNNLVSDLECGDPATISHGSFRLLNGTHRFGSVVRYECAAGHLLAGSVRIAEIKL